MESVTRRARLQLQAEGKMQPSPRPVQKRPKAQDCSKMLKDVRHALFIFPHGLGDCVLFTPVIQHLRAAYPNLKIDIQCRAEFAGVFHGHARTWALDEDPEGDYQLQDRVPWFMPTQVYHNCPSNKPSRYLIESLGIGPAVGLCGYRVKPKADHELAAEGLFEEALRKRLTDSRKRLGVVLHHEGRTLGEKKNLDEATVRRVVAVAARWGHPVLLLDLDRTSPLAALDGVPGGVTVIDRTHGVWGGEEPSPGVIAAIANRAALCVGIDSGPGHLFGCTDTPTIIAWTKHHPVNHYGLSHNVTHLVPADHAENLPASVTGDLGFFDGWYRYAKYSPGQLPNELAAAVHNSLTMDRKSRIRVTVPQGVGDIFWVYQKLAPHYSTIDFDLGMVNVNVIEDRSVEIMPMFPKVGKCWRRPMPQDDYNELVARKDSFDSVRKSWESGVASASYSVNRSLEEGVRLEAIDGKEVQWDVPLRTDRAPIPFTRFATLAVSGGTLSVAQVWSVDQWVEFISLLYEKFVIDLPLVHIGAEFDRAVMEQVNGKLEKLGHRTMMLCNVPFGQKVDALQRTELHIGYQSGLNILAANFDRPQVMVYFNWLPHMRDTWVKPGTKHFNCFLFKESPQEAASKVSLPFREHRGECAMLSTWGIGDFLAVYSFMSPLERQRVNTIYWANRNRHIMQDVVAKAFPNLSKQIELVKEFGEPDTLEFCFKSLADLRDKMRRNGRRIPSDATLDGAADLNMDTLAKQVASGERIYHGMGPLAGELADIVRFELPKDYVAIHAYSQNARKGFRDFTPSEWRAVVSYLKRHEKVGVVIGTGPFLVPEKYVDGKTVIDLSNRLSQTLELMEVVRGASGFIGCASVFSVQASKHLRGEQMYVKAHHSIWEWWRVYYAPQPFPCFLHRDLLFMDQFVEPDPWVRYAASLSDGNPFDEDVRMLEVCSEIEIAYQSNLRTTIDYGRDYVREFLRREGTPINARLNRFRAELVEKYCPNAVLDFGAGSGTFIKTCRRKCYGCDVNERTERWLRQRGIWHDFWRDGLPADADGVCAWDVLEHLPRPTEFLWKVPAHKYLFVTIPVIRDWKNIRASKHYKPGEHLVYFTDRGFQEYVRTIGFNVLEVRDDEVAIGREDVKTYVLQRV